MRRNRQLWQSQNFLRRTEFVSGLIDKTNISSNDLVVEIGPGKGIITRQLAQRAGKVIAVEVDPHLAYKLIGEFAGNTKVKIIQEDFRRFHLPKEPYKVFSNPPFNMTAEIVKKLLEDRYSPEVAFLIMQDKAYERFAGVGKENQTSILLKPWFDINTLTGISRNEYSPRPNADTVLAEFKKRENPLIANDKRQGYRDFVIHGFNGWKPSLLEVYSNVFSGKQMRIIERNIKLKGKKPSEVLFEHWLELFNTFDTHVSIEKQDVVKGAERQQQNKHKKHQKWHRTR